MPTVTIPGVDQAQIDDEAEKNFAQITGWAEEILLDAKDHAETPEELSAWVKAAWWEHEDELTLMAERSERLGRLTQRENVVRATSGALSPGSVTEVDVSLEVESLMKLGEWLAKQAVKAWYAAHPEAVAAANDDQPEENFSPLAKVTIGTITAMLMLGASAQVMALLAQSGSNLTVTKTWHTQHDGRVRDSHRGVDGQTVGLGAMFSIGVDHPSDRNGEPAEVYGCRCFLTYDVTYGALGAAQGGTMGTAFEGILTLTGPDTMTGDGRSFDAGAVYWDPPEAPWPFKFEHDGPTVGQVNELWYDGTTLRGKGVFHDDSADLETQTLAARAIELLDVWGVSIELDSEVLEVRVKAEVWDQIEADYKRINEDGDALPEVPGEKDGRVTTDETSFDDALRVFTSARFRGAALVDTAAFNDAKVAIKASLALAAANGESPFQNPKFGADGDHDPRLVWQKPQRPEESPGWGCPFTVTDDGRVFGHVALRYRCHGAFAACVPPPDSGGDFSYFLTGEAERGTATGPVILGTTHGVTDDGRVKSHNHLADTGQAVADVIVGTDSHGTWCAGRLRPGVTERQIADLKGSSLSGEWHPINGKLRLVGILAVNSPGFLVQRRQLALAASFTTGADCCPDADPMAMKVAELERELVKTWAENLA